MDVSDLAIFSFFPSLLCCLLRQVAGFVQDSFFKNALTNIHQELNVKGRRNQKTDYKEQIRDLELFISKKRTCQDHMAVIQIFGVLLGGVS